MADVLTLIGPASGGIGFSTVFILIMFFILAITAIHVYYKSQESYKLGLQIPGPEPLPILGNALMALGKTPNRKHFFCIQIMCCVQFCFIKCSLFL